MNMKNNYLLIFLSLFLASISFGQSLELEIIHKLNREDFAYDMRGITNLNQQFEVKRLEYYLSEITVVHDGGQESSIDSLWVLVNADNPTSTIDLSEINTDSIEGVKMHVGVSPDVNNEDPSLWPSAHPLAHKNPSMHWGWLAGYRFVAMEGTAVLAPDYQVHALGNDNYFQTSFEPNVSVDGMNTTMSVYADYSKALYDVDLSGGVITHGEEDEAIVVLENFRDRVFTPIEPTDSVPSSGGNGGPSDTTNSIQNISSLSGLSLFPNPSNTGQVTLRSVSNNTKLSVDVFDLTGKSAGVNYTRVNSNEMNLSFDTPGVYLIRMTDNSSGQQKTQRILILE